MRLNWLDIGPNCDISVNSHRRIARVIYDKHISEDCGEPVNLPQRESSTILNALESEQALNRFLFDDAAEECDHNSHVTYDLYMGLYVGMARNRTKNRDFFLKLV